MDQETHQAEQDPKFAQLGDWAQRLVSRTGQLRSGLSPWIQRALEAEGRGGIGQRRPIAFSERHTHALLERVSRMTEESRVWRPDVGSVSPAALEHFAGDIVRRREPLADKYRVEVPEWKPEEGTSLVLAPGLLQGAGVSQRGGRQPEPYTGSFIPPPPISAPEQPLTPTQPPIRAGREAVQRKPGTRVFSRVEEIAPASQQPPDMELPRPDRGKEEPALPIEAGEEALEPAPPPAVPVEHLPETERLPVAPTEPAPSPPTERPTTRPALQRRVDESRVTGPTPREERAPSLATQRPAPPPVETRPPERVATRPHEPAEEPTPPLVTEEPVFPVVQARPVEMLPEPPIEPVESEAPAAQVEPTTPQPVIPAPHEEPPTEGVSPLPPLKGKEPEPRAVQAMPLVERPPSEEAPPPRVAERARPSEKAAAPERGFPPAEGRPPVQRRPEKPPVAAPPEVPREAAPSRPGVSQEIPVPPPEVPVPGLPVAEGQPPVQRRVEREEPALLPSWEEGAWPPTGEAPPVAEPGRTGAEPKLPLGEPGPSPRGWVGAEEPAAPSQIEQAAPPIGEAEPGPSVQRQAERQEPVRPSFGEEEEQVTPPAARAEEMPLVQRRVEREEPAAETEGRRPVAERVPPVERKEIAPLLPPAQEGLPPEVEQAARPAVEAEARRPVAERVPPGERKEIAPLPPPAEEVLPPEVEQPAPSTAEAGPRLPEAVQRWVGEEELAPSEEAEQAAPPIADVSPVARPELPLAEPGPPAAERRPPVLRRREGEEPAPPPRLEEEAPPAVRQAVPPAEQPRVVEAGPPAEGIAVQRRAETEAEAEGPAYPPGPVPEETAPLETRPPAVQLRPGLDERLLARAESRRHLPLTEVPWSGERPEPGRAVQPKAQVRAGAEEAGAPGRRRPYERRALSPETEPLPLREPGITPEDKALPPLPPAVGVVQRLPLAIQVVQRTAEEPAAIIQRAMGEEVEQEELDLDDLARQVYPIIKRMLAIERERLPWYR